MITQGDTLREEVRAFLSKNNISTPDFLVCGLFDSTLFHRNSHEDITLTFSSIAYHHGGTLTFIGTNPSIAFKLIEQEGYEDSCSYIKAPSVDVMKGMEAGGESFDVIFLGHGCSKEDYYSAYGIMKFPSFLATASVDIAKVMQQDHIPMKSINTETGLIYIRDV